MSRAPDDTGGIDILVLPRRENRAADEPRIVWHPGEADADDDVCQARPKVKMKTIASRMPGIAIQRSAKRMIAMSTQRR